MRDQFTTRRQREDTTRDLSMLRVVDQKGFFRYLDVVFQLVDGFKQVIFIGTLILVLPLQFVQGAALRFQLRLQVGQ